MSETLECPFCGTKFPANPPTPDLAAPLAAERGDVVTIRAEEWTRMVAAEANCRCARPASDGADATQLRETLVDALGWAREAQLADLSQALGLGTFIGKGEVRWQRVRAIADALLAAVARPAEARGEPWGYACRVRYTDNVASDWWIRFRTEELPMSHQAQIIPLYAHPAPSGGEAVASTDGLGHTTTGHINPAHITPTYTAPRPEPGEPSIADVASLARSLTPQQLHDLLVLRVFNGTYYGTGLAAAIDAALAAQRGTA